MSLKIDDIFVEFECSKCNKKLMASINDLIIIGHPICIDCDEEMDYDDEVQIPKLGNQLKSTP
jgi:Zn finger protein HypA/HybF involved in hydrogenase expression